MLQLSAKPRHKKAPRPAEKSAPAFLQWIRGRQCVFASHGGCEGKIEAMHLDFAGEKGMGTKVRDAAAVPACSGHHRRQHNRGWNTFLREMEVTKTELLAAADFLWGKWPGRSAWQRKVNA